MTILGREPVLWLALVQALLACGIGFGLSLTTEQMALVLSATGAILAFLARGATTPQAPANVDDLKAYIGKAAPAVIDKAGVKIITTNKTIALLVGTLLGAALLATPATAAPARWSFDRASLGLSAQGAIFDQTERVSAFLPGVSLSYSLSPSLSLAGIVERDFARHLTLARAGGRFLVWHNERGQLGAGADLVSYADQGAARFALVDPTSWQASVNGSWAIARNDGERTQVWGIASASLDPENEITTYRLGLRYQLVGGDRTEEAR